MLKITSFCGEPSPSPTFAIYIYTTAHVHIWPSLIYCKHKSYHSKKIHGQTTHVKIKPTKSRINEKLATDTCTCNYIVRVLVLRQRNKGTPKVPASGTHSYRASSHTRHYLDLHAPFTCTCCLVVAVNFLW